MSRIRMQGVGKPVNTPLVCSNTKPRFYRIPSGDRWFDDNGRSHQDWLTKSAGRSTCPDDGSAVVTVTRDGRRVNLCLTCLS